MIAWHKLIMDISWFINAAILGLVEGLTEFLPVSSTGHLILVNQWCGFPSESFTKVFDVFIQSGAILAVIIYFRKKLLPAYATQTSEERAGIRSLWWKTLVGFLPAAVIGFLAGDFVERSLMTPLVVAASLVLWGIVLIAIEAWNIRRRTSGLVPRSAETKDLTLTSVLIIGFAQCLAMVPGTSRSAATIVAALLLGTSRAAAAEFSFYLAIPTLIAASGYSLLKLLLGGISISLAEAACLAVGTIVSFAVAWAVIPPFMGYIKRRDFRVFGWYRIVLGLVVLACLYGLGRLL
jgi:Uncharacterized bacitracin resistance protein